MPRRILLPFLACGLLFAALPLGLSKPGLPLALRGDEADYLGSAYSLWQDHDLAFAEADAERVFGQFPFDDQVELRLQTPAEGGRRYDLPLLYPLLAAPALALLGSNGILVFNLLLLLASIGLAVLFLARRGESATLYFALPFVLLSPAFIYAFWMRPSALLFFLGMAAITEGWADERPLPRWRRALAGAALGLAALYVPALLLLAIPLLLQLGRRERSGLPAFAVGLVAAFAIFALVQHQTLGAPYHDGHAYIFTKASDEPWRVPGAALADPEPRPFSGERLLGSLIERRRGFLPYFPLALLALALWRAPRREGWMLAALGVAILAQPFTAVAWPGLPMNPDLLPFYPAFLVFARRIPRLAVVAGAVVATYLLGLQLFGVLGSPIPDGGAHGHVRAFPFNRLPLDPYEVGPGSGLVKLELSGDAPAPTLWAAADQALLGGRELWTYGGEKVELWLESARPLDEIKIQVRTVATPNEIELRHAGGREHYQFQPGAAISQRSIHLRDGVKNGRGNWLYRLELASRGGAKPIWTGESEVDYYIGAAFAYIGTPEETARDLYRVEWLSCGFPPATPAGVDGLALVRARNGSPFLWPSQGATRVRFASRWLDGEGKRILESPERSPLLYPVEPGGELSSWLKVRVPEAPGAYTLEFDAVLENVAWFSDRNGGSTCRQQVEVRPRG